MVNTSVEKSTEQYGNTFATAVWRNQRLVIQRNAVKTVYKQFCDCDAADVGEEPFPDLHETTARTIEETPDPTALAAVISATSALTTAKRRTVLVKALLDNESAEEIADDSSLLYGGTVV